MPPSESFTKDGYQSMATLRKSRRLMIGTDGLSDTGKTEFILSAPGPGLVIALDRNFDAMLKNEDPPPTRRDDFYFKSISVPLATAATQNEFLDYWRVFRKAFYEALANPQARTIGLDGDSDSWELQRLAEFGKLTQIPPILYTGVNSARRSLIARAWDSGKIVIATNKVKGEYIDKLKADGTIELNDSGKPVRVMNGEYKRQGFEDQDYLWQIQIRHLFAPARTNIVTGKAIPKQWGLRIMKCKANKDLEGTELWGGDCNFAGLVQYVYPSIPLKEWGY